MQWQWTTSSLNPKLLPISGDILQKDKQQKPIDGCKESKGAYGYLSFPLSYTIG